MVVVSDARTVTGNKVVNVGTVVLRHHHHHSVYSRCVNWADLHDWGDSVDRLDHGRNVEKLAAVRASLGGKLGHGQVPWILDAEQKRFTGSEVSDVS